MRWIIGDIHGMTRPLEATLSAVSRRDPAARLFFCGDYVDRGPDTAGVLSLLSTLPNAAFARGNHDDALDLVLHGACYAPPLARPSRGSGRTVAESNFAAMAGVGMLETFASYGVDPRDAVRVARMPTYEGLCGLASAVPEAHKAFLRGLPPVVEEDDFFVGHAWWSPSYPDEFGRLAFNPAVRHEALWGRFTREELTSDKRWGRRGYFGHTPTTHYGFGRLRPSLFAAAQRGGGLVPVEGRGLVLLDTGCGVFADGRLTAYCHETGEYLQATADGEVLTGSADVRGAAVR